MTSTGYHPRLLFVRSETESNNLMVCGGGDWSLFMPSRIPVCRAAAIALVTLVCLAVAPLFAAAPLFPAAMHLTRTMDDPLTGRSTTVEEYYLANRVVTVAGNRTVVVDYDRQDVTEIDRARATYSVTKFEEIAAFRQVTSAAKPAKGTVARTGSARRAGRNVDVFSSDDSAASFHAEIAVDASVHLNRDAFDVLTGSAYPNNGAGASEVVRAAARRQVGRMQADSTGAADAESYGLPLEQTFRWNVAGKTLTSTNTITRVGEEIAPSDLVAIPPGAKLVVSHVVEAKRLNDELDSLRPAPPTAH